MAREPTVSFRLRRARASTMTDAMPTDLWEPERHTKLLDASWDESAARFAIDDIVADARSSFSAESLWPAHPNDGDAGGEAWRNLYFGAAGIVWALDYLAKAGACAAGDSFGSAAHSRLEPNRKQNEWFGGSTAGLLLGDTGILIAQWRTSPASEVKDARWPRRSLATVHHPSLEFMWGSPGARGGRSRDVRLDRRSALGRPWCAPAPMRSRVR